MYVSTATWDRGQRCATAASMRFGPQASTSSASGAAATTVPAKPALPSSVARITSSPSVSEQSSSAVRAPCTHVTCMPAARASRAASGIGATPSPPLMRVTVFAEWERSKARPSGPRQLATSPSRIASICAVPTPTALSTTSMRSPTARYTENGRRSSGPACRAMFTNCPALTDAAISGAAKPSTHMSRATWRRSTSGASVRNKRGASPLLDRPDDHLRRHLRRRLQQCGGRVERCQAGDAALDGCAPDLEAILDDRATVIARILVDVRHGVEHEVDLAAGDDVEHCRALLADLRHHARREARALESLRGALGGHEPAAHLYEPRHDREHLGLVRIGDGEEHRTALRHVHA